MSHMTNESDDSLHSENHSESLSAGGSSSGGRRWDGAVLKKGPWTTAEDAILVEYVKNHGEGNWNAVQKHTGLSRCGKSCRLRWANHLRPNLKKGAFNQEEEQLIIELHAKMGNKWARMASHMPGRTDNEIKNYWNTRIKRRQRANLPLYPPEMHVQPVHDNQDHGKSGVIGVAKRYQGFLQANSYEPYVALDGYKGTDALPFASDLPDLSTYEMLTNSASSLQCDTSEPLFMHCQKRYRGSGALQCDTYEPPFTHCQKRYRGSGALFPGCSTIVKNGYSSFDNLQDIAPQKISRSFALSLPCDPDLPRESIHLDAFPGSHALSNGNCPASKPTFEDVKLELPSFQYLETDSERWNTSPPSGLTDSGDTFIQCLPPAGAVESCCVSPHDSGLLDMMLHEPRIRNGRKEETDPVEKSYYSTSFGGIADCVYMGVSETKSKDPYDPFNPFVYSTNSTISESTETRLAGSSPDGYSSFAETFPGANLKSEPADQVWNSTTTKDSVPELDVTRPDVIFAMSLL